MTIVLVAVLVAIAALGLICTVVPQRVRRFGDRNKNRLGAYAPQPFTRGSGEFTAAAIRGLGIGILLFAVFLIWLQLAA